MRFALQLAGALYLLLVVGCVLYVSGTYLLAFIGRAPRPHRLYWRAAVYELGAVLLLMPLWPLWLLVGGSYRARHEGEGTLKQNPVILLHGLAMNRTNWFWLGRHLVKRGITPLYGTSYFSPQSVARSAEHLAQFVQYVLSREDAARVDIVAHSLGGLVARYFVEQLGGGDKVARLITIASPHRGTLLAKGGILPVLRDLALDSDFFASLGGKPDGVEYLSIWSPQDAMIVPADAASVEPLGKDLIVPGLGHLSLLLSAEVADRIARTLRGA